MITHVRSRRKNQISYDMLIVALKAYCDMVDAGFTENLARRSLSCILNIYATNPHVGQKYPVSKAAHGLAKSELIHEHGTPRARMTDMFVEAYRNGTLTEALAIQYSTDLYRVAYVTKAEDLRLTALGLRSKAFDTPEARWAAAGIEF